MLLHLVTKKIVPSAAGGSTFGESGRCRVESEMGTAPEIKCSASF